MTRFAIVLAAGTVLATPAMALDIPTAGSADPNVRTADYNPGKRWLLVGVVGRNTTITFGPREEVYRVLFGPPGAWSAPGLDALKDAPLGNVLPLRAEAATPSTVQVITKTTEGVQRLYNFSLLARPAPDPEKCTPAVGFSVSGSRPAAATELCDPPDATYSLVFTYKNEERDAALFLARQQAAETARARDLQVSKARLDVDPFYGRTNWKYVARGDETKGDFIIAPTEVSDNTQSTKFRFPGNMRVPAVFMVGPDGQEQTVKAIPMDDFVMVYGTARHWVIREGALVLGIDNLGYDPVGFNPRTGTTSPEVLRIVRPAKGNR